MVTEPAGDVLTVTPSYRNQPNEPKFAMYIVNWTKRNIAYNGGSGVTVGEILGLGVEVQEGVEFYSSYEVTVRLTGKERTYRAMALYRKAAQPGGRRRVEILDNVTSSLNDVLEDQSPLVRSPWRTYVTSASYFATLRTIKEARERGVSPMGEDMAIGSLPGDGAAPAQEDVQKAKEAASASCAVPPVTTDDVVVIGWVDGNTITLPQDASFELKVALNTSTATCLEQVGSWALGFPVNLSSDSDRAYANAFLLKNSANKKPPNPINPSMVLSNGDFRLFNRLQVQFTVSNGQISNPQYLQSVSAVGSTPNPCNRLFPYLAGEVHLWNGDKAVIFGRTVYQLNEGRIGSTGQDVSRTINRRTVPWIWNVIKFDRNGVINILDNSQFPTYSVYKNGQLLYSFPQIALPSFILKDETWQRYPWQIQ